MPLKRSHKFILILLLLLGTALQGLTMFRSGLFYNFGLGFWGANAHDGLWHLSLAGQVFRGFPIPHPTFSESLLTNYHFFYDFLLSLVNKVTFIPLSVLYFQIFPILLSFTLGFLSFWVGYLWRKDFWTGFWLAFLNYFATSFGFLVTLFKSFDLGGESLFWSMQSISTLINPPFALSLIFLLSGLLILLKVKKWNYPKVIGLALLFGILINVKFYAGVVGLVGLGVYSLLKLFKNEKVYLYLFLLSSLISLIIFIPFNFGASSLIIFKPFWFIHSMLESPDRFYLPKIVLARYFLITQGFGPRLFLIEAIGLFVFIVGNLGARIFGLFGFIKSFKDKQKEFNWFLISGGLVGLVIPLLFVQKGTAWNTIQFFYYFLFFFNFYLAFSLSSFMKFKKLGVFLVLLVLLLIIPGNIGSLRNYFGWPPPATIFKEEKEALDFLKKEEQGVVLTFPYNKYQKDQYKKTPLPVYVYESTAYVSAFSLKQSFLADEVNLNISGYDWQGRRDEVIKFFESENKAWARGFLLNNQIAYIYLVEDQEIILSEEDLGIDLIFNNQKVKIYQVHGII